MSGRNACVALKDFQVDMLETMGGFSGAVDAQNKLLEGKTKYEEGFWSRSDTSIWERFVNKAYEVDFKYYAQSDTMSNTFIFLDMMDIQNKLLLGLGETSIHDFHFCRLPGEVTESGFSEFALDIFWSMAVYWKHCGTTGFRLWDEEFNVFKEKLVDPSTEEFHIYTFDDNDIQFDQVQIKDLPNECSICKSFTKTRCKRCKSIRYCSRECQKSDWKHHKPDCHLPSIVYFSEDEDDIMRNSHKLKEVTFHETYFVEDGLECSECHHVKDYFDFSKSQIVKDERRRCKECVESTPPPPPKISNLYCNDCGETKESTEFSKSQRSNNYSKRKCILCVEKLNEARRNETKWYEGREHIFKSPQTTESLEESN